jgi:hypothetical protein
MINPLAEKTVYEQVVDVTYEYLGPAAERFVARGIEAHLGKKPEELTKEDIEKLLDWSRLSLALLTEDAHIVDNFTQNMLSISENAGTGN